jgi:hypothetical protein
MDRISLQRTGLLSVFPVPISRTERIVVMAGFSLPLLAVAG